MSRHAEVKAALEAHPGLQALVGQRIRVDLANEDDAYPFVVYKRSSLDKTLGLDNSVHATQEIFEIECWAHNRSQSIDVSEQVMLAMADADLPVETAQPDGIDPQMLERVTVLTVEIWS